MFHQPVAPPPGAAPVRPDERPDQRAVRRHATVLLIGRVRHRSGGETACLVHDISAHGLMARFTLAPVVGDRVSIEVRGLAEVAATIRWVDGFRGGVEFDAAQDIAGVFCLRDDQGHVARTPRFTMTASVSLRIADRRVAVDILDISPGGAKLRGDVSFDIGQAGSIVLPELDTAVFGVVCWTREDRCGLHFCTPLPLATLSRVLGCG